MSSAKPLISRHPLARGLLQGSGAALLAVGILHLAMTDRLRHWMVGQMSKPQAAVLLPPAILNHVLTGVLLLPLGICAIVAARALGDGSRWPWWLALTSSASALALPITVLVVIDVAQYPSWPFWTAVVIVFAIPLAMLPAVFALRPRRSAASDLSHGT